MPDTPRPVPTLDEARAARTPEHSVRICYDPATGAHRWWCTCGASSPDPRPVVAPYQPTRTA